MNPTETIISNLALVTDGDDMNEIIRHVKAAQKRISEQAVRSFKVGDRVAFDTGKGRYEGTVTKVNRKTVGVDCDVLDGRTLDFSQGYRVSGSLLEAV